MSIFDFWTDVIGVDPGTQNLRIVKDGEIVFNERSQISIDKIDGVVSGFGNSIRTTINDAILKPVNCTIWDFHAFEMLLREAIKKASNKKHVIPKSYIMYFSIPSSTSEVEKRAYRDSGEHAAAKELYMIHHCYCAAVSLNILFEKKDFVLIDFSSSRFEITIFAAGILICVGELRLGTWKIFSIIKNYIQRTYRVELNDNEIADLIIDLDEAQDHVTIQYTTISTKEIQKVIDSYFNLVNDVVLETFELVSDHPDMRKVLMNGVYFTGGGSMYSYLRKQIKLEGEIEYKVSNTPLLDNINGLRIIMADKEKFKSYLMT